MFFKISLLINFPIFTRKYLCCSLFLIKLYAWWSAILLKNRPLHSCFPVNITECLRMAFCMEHLPWLLLKMVEEFVRISQLEKYLYRRIHKGERFVKMLYGKWRHEILFNNLWVFNIFVLLAVIILQYLYDSVNMPWEFGFPLKHL